MASSGFTLQKHYDGNLSLFRKPELQHSKECMCCLQNIAICDYQESVTNRQTPDKVIPMCHYALQTIQNPIAAFQGMHVLPAKHSNVWLPRKCDYQTDRRRTKWSLYATMLYSWYKTRMAEFQGMHVLPAKHSYGCLPRMCDWCRTKLSLYATMLYSWYKTRMAEFQGMHVLPAKHSYGCLPRMCDWCRTKWSLCATLQKTVEIEKTSLYIWK